MVKIPKISLLLVALLWTSCDCGGVKTETEDAGDNCEPTAEICDGKDNDCDGTIDNEPQASQACNDQDRCTEDICQAGSCTNYPSGGCDYWDWTSTLGAPDGRYRHTAIWTGTRMIIWGGSGGIDAEIYRDGSSYDPIADTWRVIDTDTRDGPRWRILHTAVWTGEEMIIWGGVNYPDPYYNTGGRYKPLTNTWQPTEYLYAPAARAYHSAVWTGSEMIVWGGIVAQEAEWRINTGGRYNPSDDSWVFTNTADAPSARGNHSAVWTGSKMIIWGGLDTENNVLNTGALYDPSDDSWSPMSTSGAPPGAYDHSAVWTGTVMLVWGGSGESANLSSGGIYHPENDTWSSLPSDDAAEPRSGHCTVWTGDEMIVWGGTTNTEDNSETGAAYNYANNSWRATNTIAVPKGRTYPVAVWAGDHMIIWGGWRWNADNTTEYMDTGARYYP